MFLGTVAIDGQSKDCIIKLATRSYGIEVHRHLAQNGLAPTLFGVSKMAGTPMAIAMESLRPQNKGIAGWASLYDLTHAKDKKFTTTEERNSLKRALYKVLDCLKASQFVHGDLRDVNMMVYVNADGTVLDAAKEVGLKIVDFDWSGGSGKVYYPLSRNPDLSWPGTLGDKIVFEHDMHWVESISQKT